MLNVRIYTAFYLSRQVPSEPFKFESNHIRGVMYAKININFRSCRRIRNMVLKINDNGPGILSD